MTLAELHSLVLQVAPELATAPLYLVEHPAALSVPRTVCRGYALVHTAPALRQSLVDAGQWQGPGRFIGILDTEPTKLLGLVLHEVSHLLPARSILPLDIPPLPDVVEKDAAEFKAFVQAEEAPDLRAAHHGREFTRTACHLWWRMALLGFVARLDWAAGWQYDRSGFDSYLSACGAEPMEMQGATFAEIHATPEPAAFAELADQDEADVRAAVKERARQKKLQQERGQENDHAGSN